MKTEIIDFTSNLMAGEELKEKEIACKASIDFYDETESQFRNFLKKPNKTFKKELAEDVIELEERYIIWLRKTKSNPQYIRTTEQTIALIKAGKYSDEQLEYIKATKIIPND